MESDCADGGPCLESKCNPETGCEYPNVADGTACPTDAACKVAACNSGECIESASTVDTVWDDSQHKGVWLRTLAQDSQGGFATVGWRDGDAGSRMWVQRITAGGVEVCHREEPEQEGVGRFYDVLLLDGDDTFYAFGLRGNETEHHVAVARSYDSECTPFDDPVVYAAGDTSRLQGAVAREDGAGFALVGDVGYEDDQGESTSRSAWLVLTDMELNDQGATEVPASEWGEGLTHARFYNVERTDSGFVAVGEVGTVTQTRGALAGFGADGALLWVERYQHHASNVDITERLRHVVHPPGEDGGLLVVGKAGVTSAEKTNGAFWLLRVSEDGQVAWSRAVDLAPGVTEDAHWVAPTADGGAIVTGLANAWWDAGLLRLDQWGAEVWREVVPTTGVGFLSGVVDLDDGGFAAVGYRPAPGTSTHHAWFYRAGPWGPEAACDPSSDCAQSWEQCDDGDPCTTDGCAGGMCTEDDVPGIPWCDDACGPLAGAVQSGVADVIGCKDGSREGLPLEDWPDVAACAGGWDVPGIATDKACGSADPAGWEGCAAADLCAEGWHVCLDDDYGDLDESRFADEPAVCDALCAPEAAFYAIARSGIGGAACDGDGDNDVFGCAVGVAAFPGDDLTSPEFAYSVAAWNGPEEQKCQLVSHFLRFHRCPWSGELPGAWECGDSDPHEAANVTKPSAALGGVLCCRDVQTCETDDDCATPDDCTQATCVDGTCQLSAPAWFDGISGDHSGMSLWDTIALEAGGFMMVGSTADGWAVPATGTAWWVQVDASGQVIPDTDTTFGGAGRAWAAVEQPQADGSSRIVVVGSTTTDETEGLDGMIFWVGDDDAPPPYFAGEAGADELFDVTVLEDGRLVAVGSTDANTEAAEHWILLEQPDGSFQESTHGGAGKSELWAVAALDDGGFVAVGNDQGHVFLMTYDACGVKDWFSGEDFDGLAGSARGVAVHPDGGFVLAGFAYTPDGPANLNGFVLRTTADGHGVAWLEAVGTDLLDTIHTPPVILSDGGILAGGSVHHSAGAAGGEAAMLWRLDAAGAQVWERPYPTSVVQGLIQLPAGGYVIGLDPAGGPPTMVQTDPWGYTSCADAGECHGVSEADVDDTDPCTTDYCDAATGEAHDPLAAGTSCVAGPCELPGECAGEVCIGGGPRLFEQTFDTPGDETLFDATLRASGDIVLTGFVDNGDEDKQALLVTTDSAGSTWNAQQFGEVGQSTDDRAYSAIETSEGLLVVAGQTGGEGWLFWPEQPDFDTTFEDATTLFDVAEVGDAAPTEEGRRPLVAVGLAAGGSGGVIVHVDEYGNQTLVDGPLSSSGEGLRRVLSRCGGGFVVAGQHGEGAGDFWLLAYDAQLQLVDEHTYGGSTLEVLRGLAAHGDGFVLTGWRYTDGVADAWALVTDADGNEQQSLLLEHESTHQSMPLDAISEGGLLLVAGNVLDADKAPVSIWTSVLAPSGETVWHQPYGDHDVVVRGMSRLPGGDILLAGNHHGGGGFWLGRFDAWGHPTCEQAGGCADLGAGQCSDDDACTLDSCQPVEQSLCVNEAWACDAE